MAASVYPVHSARWGENYLLCCGSGEFYTKRFAHFLDGI